ncbi:MAG: rhamnogalacturonan acetylesterase [Lachnospiraceae bacterium]|nr:rhamnogalacturonan acetylesterase [Lachnospiraceae bacterium]
MKPVIYLASDSTVQSYDPALYPQTGWGQVLIHAFFGTLSDAAAHAPGEYPSQIRVSHPATTAFSHVIRYDTDRIAIDNRAFAGRSARSFYDEGRLDDLAACLKPGDYLFLQFAHNDANASKPERYIPIEEYPNWLDLYVRTAKKAGATPVLITAITMRTFCADGSLPVSFPDYRQAMLTYAEQKHLPCIDLGELTRAYCEALGPEGTRNIFMCLNKGEYPGGPYCEGKEDNAHLQYQGALAFAGLLADGIRSCPQLRELAAYLP